MKKMSVCFRSDFVVSECIEFIHFIVIFVGQTIFVGYIFVIFIAVL